MKQKNQNLTTEQINAIVKELDYQGNGKINYTEFLSATLDIQTIITDARMRSLFNVFDTDASGFITQENIKYAFQKLGQEVPDDVIRSLIVKHDRK